MIWKPFQLNKSIKKDISVHLDKQLFKQRYLSNPGRLCFAIVGGGPKGMYALDNLLNSLEDLDEQPIFIDWYNKDTNFGNGPNYNVNQPDYLLINYAIGNINAWKENTDVRLDLMSWINAHAVDGHLVKPTDFASRSLVGWYLQHCCLQLLNSAKQHIYIHPIIKNIKSIGVNGLRVTIEQKSYRSAILCTGHTYPNSKELSFPSNIVLSFSDLLNQRNVTGGKFAVQGMGLTAIDIVLMLNEKWTQDKDLQIYLYSRSNLPMLPRRPQLFSDNKKRLLLADEWNQLLNKIHLDFEAHILPVLRREMQLAYYASVTGLQTEVAIQAYINEENDADVFTLEKLLFPNKSLAVDAGEEYHQWMIRYLENHIDICKYNPTHPILDAIDTLRLILPYFARFYGFRRLNGKSQMDFDEYWYPAISRVLFGPPIENGEKILKLMKQNRVRCLFNKPPFIETEQDKIVLYNETKRIYCDHVIFANVPRANLLNNKHQIYSLLLENESARIYKNQNYSPGTVEIDQKGNILDKKGASYGLFAYGTPTEGIVLDNDTLSRYTHDFSKNWVKYILQQITISHHAK